MNSIVEAWSALPMPASALRWSAAPLAGNLRIARTPSDGAALLCRSDATVDTGAFSLTTAHVTYQVARPLAIEGDPAGQQPYLVLECDGGDADLLMHFLRIVERLGLASSHGQEFDRAVRSIFELFRSLSQPGTGTPQGLWAELLLFTLAKDPSYLAAAWHSEPGDLHDFVGAGSRLEVKSSVRTVREHDFSLEQLERDVQNTVIVSVMLTESSSGANVLDLLDDALSKIDGIDLRDRVNRIARKTLGEGWREALDLRFDLPQAVAGLRAFEARHVPRVTLPLPVGIRNVRFVADLSNAEHLFTSPKHALLMALRG